MLTIRHLTPTRLAMSTAVALFGLFAGSATPVQAAPLLFDSDARIVYVGESGGVHHYDLSLSATEHPYREFKMALDPELVTPNHHGMRVGEDVEFLTAELLGMPEVEIYFSVNGRKIANVNDRRFLDLDLFDSYDPLETSAIPEDTYAITLRMGFNRELSCPEQGHLGYWVGDLRGIIAPDAFPFTESDGIPQVIVGSDIKPGSCPNAVNTRRQGVMSVAVLGSADLDVSEIDPQTVTLAGISPLRWSIEDVSGAAPTDDCSCDPGPGGSDGMDDLVLKYGVQDVLSMLPPFGHKDEVLVLLEGMLGDSTAILGMDCLSMRANGNDGGPNGRAVERVAFTGGVAVMGASHPTEPTQRIQFRLSEPGSVTLRVFDPQGRSVRSWGPMQRGAGTHEVSWDAAERVSGVYFLQLTTKRETVTGKQLVMR